MERMTVERMTGIEPALSAWEADVLPLNYIRRVRSPPAAGASAVLAHTSYRKRSVLGRYRQGVLEGVASCGAPSGPAGCADASSGHAVRPTATLCRCREGSAASARQPGAAHPGRHGH